MKRSTTWILLGLAAGLGTASIYNLAAPPVYRAGCLVLIERWSGERGPAAAEGDRAYLDFYRRQYGLIRSLSTVRAALKSAAAAGSETLEFKGPGAAEQARLRVRVEPVEGSVSLVRVSFEGRYPQEARRMADEIVRAYKIQQEQRQSRPAGSSPAWITENMPKLREQLDASKKTLKAFQDRNGIVSIDSQLGRFKQEQERLGHELTQITLRRIAMEARHEQVRRAGPEKLMEMPFLAEAEPVAGLLRRRRDLLVVRSEQLQRFGPRHDAVLTTDEKLKAMEKQLQSELKLLASKARVDYEVAQAQEKKLRSLLEGSEVRSRAFSRKAAELQGLRAETDEIQRHYDALSQKIRSVSLETTARQARVTVIDPAQHPRRPVAPRRSLNLIGGGAAGLLLGLLLAAFLKWSVASSR